MIPEMPNFKYMILRWFETAKWWHFWNPGSGLPGGTIAGAILVTGILIWMRA